MKFDDIRSYEVQLFAANRRFRVLLWVNNPGDVLVKEITFESGEVLDGHPVGYGSVEQAKMAAEESVRIWAVGK